MILVLKLILSFHFTNSSKHNLNVRQNRQFREGGFSFTFKWDQGETCQSTAVKTINTLKTFIPITPRNFRGAQLVWHTSVLSSA